MFRIRRISDGVLPVNQTAIREVRKIFREQFSAAAPGEIEQLTEKLSNPFLQRFRTLLYVAENSRGHVSGFAIVLHEPVIGFCYLDYLAAGKLVVGRGVGAALYEYVRDDAVGLGAKGLFFECLPDEAGGSRVEAVRKQNAARLRFYERYGARPIVGTAYETPVPGGSDDNVPHLVYDDLDQDRPLSAGFARQVVTAVLERKYRHLCPPAYVRQVVQSFQDDPVRLRSRKSRAALEHKPAAPHPTERAVMTINDRHEIHHVHERGYVEAPVRISVIRQALEEAGLVRVAPVKDYPLRHIEAVHDRELVHYLKAVCANTPEGKSIYPYVFPIRNAARPPRELSIRAGYFCIDTFTPIHRNAFPAAKRGVDCTLTAAEALLAGDRLAYALVRPPGHHAERRVFGGFCYFNNAAVAAHFLTRHGSVAILDVDYHHGNGQQDIFYERSDVLTVSIHGAPHFAYPYFSGFADERGAGPGLGCNLNFPLPESIDGPQYLAALRQALDAVREFNPTFLIVALGLDPAKGDPTGSWTLSADDFEENGKLIASLKRPTLVVQEGGYLTRTLGKNARRFFEGLVRTHE